MVKSLTCTEMVQKFEDVLCEKKGVCIYIEGENSKTTYFADDLEVENYGEIINFKDKNGLECNLKQSSIEDIYTSDEDICEIVTIKLDTSEISFMIA